MNRIKELADKYGTPAYFYNIDTIREQYQKLKESLGDDVEIYYSMKANPNNVICRELAQMGCGIEVASIGEIKKAKEFGIDTSRIIFAGPGKKEDEIEFAIENNIKMINVESFEEIQIINDYASKLNVVVDVSLRINPDGIKNRSKIRMTGVSSQFGIDEGQVNSDFMRKVNNLKSVCVSGIQVYMGTEILNEQDIVDNTRYTLDLAKRLIDETGISINFIDFGGGFGIPYFENENELDLSSLKMSLDSLFHEYHDFLVNKELVFESGRFLVADSGYYVIKVLYVKESKGKKYVVCDGGSNFHAASAFLGRFVRSNFPIETLPNSDQMEEMTVVGSLCTPTDVIGQNIMINKSIKRGDYVVVLKSGAYGLTYSPTLFLNHESPIEVLFDTNGMDKVIKERGK